MPALAVVKHLDVLEHFAAGLISIGKAFVVREFVFKRCEKALHHRVVVGHGLATHACYEAGFLQMLLIGPAGVLPEHLDRCDGRYFVQHSMGQRHVERCNGKPLVRAAPHPNR